MSATTTITRYQVYSINPENGQERDHGTYDTEDEAQEREDEIAKTHDYPHTREVETEVDAEQWQDARATEEKRAEDEAKAEKNRAMMRSEREARENAEAEARATARTPEGCHETTRPEWWDEEAEGDDIEDEAKARAEAENEAGAEAREISARTAEHAAKAIIATARERHEDDRKARAERGTPGANAYSARALAKTEYHAEQAARWARAKAEANTSTERDRAAVQEERHGTKAQEAAETL